jgi:hypothetical protein
MAEGQILQEQLGVASQERAEEADEEVKQFGHRGRLAERVGDPVNHGQHPRSSG